jgi:hypothetical protein
MQLDGEGGEIPDKDLEDRVERVGVEPGQAGLFEDELCIDCA